MLFFRGQWRGRWKRFCFNWNRAGSSGMIIIAGEIIFYFARDQQKNTRERYYCQIVLRVNQFQTKSKVRQFDVKVVRSVNPFPNFFVGDEDAEC